MFWFMGILAGVLLGVADIVWLIRKKNVKNCIGIMIRDIIVSNITSLALMSLVFKIPNLFLPAEHSKKYPFEFFALVIAVGLVFLFCSAVVNGVLTFSKEDKPKRKAGAWIIRIIATLFAALSAAAVSASIWSTQTFAGLTPDQMLINLNSDTGGTSEEVMITMFQGPVLSTVAVTVLFAIFAFSPRKITYTLGKKSKVVFSGLGRRITALVLSIVMLSGGVMFGVEKLSLQKLISAYTDSSTYIEDNFADPNTVNITFPEKKRNLIHIYLESMENSYFSKDLGGYMDTNLLPDLEKLSKEGYNFSDRPEGQFGGNGHSTGANWSIASMVNMASGMPMKVPADRNQYGTANNFLPGATTIGDILKEQGYNQTVMFGADANFGGLRYLFEEHGDYKIMDAQYARDNGLVPPDYHVWWGYEDDKLYEFAKDEITRLANEDKPFYFAMETADTHFPDGYLSENAETPFDKQYANVIFYSQAETTKFVRWIQSQPFYENTTIVINGDHLSMDQNFFKDFDPDYRRTCFNLVLNPSPNCTSAKADRFNNREWATFDMFPTMLASIGVDIPGDRLGIGTNLFSETPTLFEHDGTDFVNTELEKRSNFYNNHVLVDWSRVGNNHKKDKQE